MIVAWIALGLVAAGLLLVVADILRSTFDRWEQHRRIAREARGSLMGGCGCGSDGSIYAPCVCGGRKPRDQLPW